MPYVGIKRYSYKPYNKNYDEFISVLSSLLKLNSKSNYWRVSSYHSLLTDWSPSGEYNESYTEWYIVELKSIGILLKHFNINKKIPVDIFIKPRKIILRKFKPELVTTNMFGDKIKKPYYYTDNDNFIVAIKSSEYYKLKLLEQPFKFKMNFFKH